MNTKKITEAAVFAGMVMAFLFVDRQTAGLIETVMFWVLPIPTIIYTVKYGYRDGIALAFAIIIGSFFIASLPTFIIVVYSTIAGFIYGSLMNKDKKVMVTLSLVFLVSLINNYLSLTVFASFFGYNIHRELTGIIEFLQYIPVLSQIVSINTVELIIPTFIVIYSILETLLLHMISTIVLNRLKIKKITFPSIYSFKISKITASVILLLITMGVIIVKSNYLNYLNYLLVMFVVLLSLVFVLLGISLMILYVSTTKIRKLTPVIMLVMILVFPYILVVIGVVDAYFDIKGKILRRIYNDRELRKN